MDAVHQGAPVGRDRSQELRITEVYASIQGESTHVGKPCTFVRLTGCNLRCTWCDSAYTFTGGTWQTIEEVLEKVHALGVRTVEVTGGEPLVQRGCVPLLQRLVAAGYEVLLETSGSRDIAAVPPEVHVILDLKPPDSGEVEANLWSNLVLLRPHHEVKVVIASRRDFDWGAEAVRAHRLAERCTVLFSPVWGAVEPAALVRWILDARLDVRFQLQLHKVVWPAETQGV
jgi:7-carboxy-7-deazaguanine synthase